MSLLNIFNIAGSAMIAQSQKLNVIASNLANMDSTIYKNGKFYPYIAKQVVFSLDTAKNSKIGGVKISAIIDDPSPMKLIYDPNNPMANNKGYILASNVNPITEMVNNIAAARSYQANIEVLKTAKSMIMKTLTISE
ncbi:flagellar basal body rod protein FlgC [Buchnera aphidicola str. APS (Acyrthosiphon pisum)]|uniref:Flagellar basal-body rod protein FlgC n=1 Tax=Buchnera aphidicola subsp. Acyrthosiphon pisum (strain APS) TaxID=107806 RepID=FLGC_BUCAI|nr:flagellar basal body rod protein FlgC [Buchnera aphidicola]P57420.1 RecName: Full=Flagellar basal-body rod protein FlgC [Buchnera aphidicola str. APS (Acyrthosiphon pisum)]pir/C84969/ flagellar basal-body rod protein flgC [imported] - Buchnera sp. (strain APS) [Buchnera sp. (in: enterobacteria)]ADP66728.1 flagellar basal-body rod protein FlgC [Buchnera aphidicola str. TLW03 (Acyrthosiphon pisum)]ADP67831.1 flagellar basal-body rod protein FlgC [Buchnera aphidicola str. JF98 (Acyrthosiphon pi